MRTDRDQQGSYSQSCCGMNGTGNFLDRRFPSHDGSRYSIGSSTVMILRVMEFNSSSPIYNVVVLPLPVGPVTSTMPFGSASASRNSLTTFGGKPS
jgi:hypothetical protein